MSDVTQMLSDIERGDSKASEQLLPLVYGELRTLAAAKLAQEKPGQALHATALVHEAYLRLVKDGSARSWDSRGHFFAAAAEAMRRILVDHARRKLSLRRGGELQRLPLEEPPQLALGDRRNEELLALNEALDRLEEVDRAKAELVKLRFFAGLTIPQSAAAIGVSVTTANRYWNYARAWLHEELQSDKDSTAD